MKTNVDQEPDGTEDEPVIDRKYWSVKTARNTAFDILNRDIWWATRLLKAHYDGTSFFHVDAYNLCALSGVWPRFFLLPGNKKYVLRFAHLNQTGFDGLTFRARFEAAYNLKKKLICKRAARHLGIKWSDIQAV